MKIEVRNDKVVIDGYVNAVGRDSRPISSPMGKFVEQIEPGAFRGSLAKRQDVDLLLNHRKDRRLGSTGGGELRLTEDSIGLRAHAEVSDSEVIEKARNGKLRGWSFGMYAGNDEFEERAGNIPRRHLKELDMFEVSLIDDSMLPCYAGTSVECRADGDVFSETRSFEDKVEVESLANAPVRDAAYWEKWLADTRARISIEDAEYRLWKLRNDFGADDSPEFRYNHNHDPTTGRFTSGRYLTTYGGDGIIISKGVGKLEQAKKRDHKVFITDVAVEKVNRVVLSDFSEGKCEEMQIKHKELLKIAKTKNNSNEVLLIDDLDLKSEVVILGDEFKVAPGENPFAVSVISNANRQSLIYMHNHPSTNNFSVADIDTFVCEETIKTMSVVTNQGEVYVMNKTDTYSYTNTRKLLKNVFDSFPNGDIDDNDFVNAFLKRCSEGGIEYAKSK